ncbi:lytic transglycosylase domain-containing protein [Orlajensenia leifsoniae]|uniref:aggregation-promoting factor C-terminal-like domain-containing protein n=1 Tax=Orlajensenia leifsoniae TaxID=2561933 RepID=UPI001F011842|nr:lytic transglycosylase domain-containing protein [Leifsonia flava]
MGRHSGVLVPVKTAVAVATPMKRPAPVRRRSRSHAALFAFAFAASAAFILVNVVDPYSGATASPYFRVPQAYDPADVQALDVAGEYEVTIQRDGYDVMAKPEPEPVIIEPAAVEEEESSGWAPPAGNPDPGTAQAIALDMVHARGWGDGEFSCLVALWDRESGWNVYASNSSSGAYGIPQALPGSKMGSAGGDWETNPATQIAWGLGYIGDRYGSPCGAWAHSEDAGWY